MITWQGPAMPQVWQFIQLDALIFLRGALFHGPFRTQQGKTSGGDTQL